MTHTSYVKAVEAGEQFNRNATARRHHTKIGFDVWEHGIVKRRIEAGGSEADDWRIGHTVVFPYTLGNPQVTDSRSHRRYPNLAHLVHGDAPRCAGTSPEPRAVYGDALAEGER